MCSEARSGSAKATIDGFGAAMKDHRHTDERGWGAKLLWLVGLWAASVAVAFAVVQLVKIAMDAAGMRTH